MRNTLSLSLFIAVLVPSHLGAQVTPPAGDRSIQVDLSKETQSITPETYGTSSLTYVSLSAWDFHPIDSTTMYSVTVTGIYLTGGTAVLEAPLKLPEGALVSYLELYGCDMNAGADIVAYLRGARNDGTWSFAPPSGLTTASLNGCGTVSTTISPVTVANATNSYTIELNFASSGDSTRSIRSFRVGYTLQVSTPPPGTQTFTDVPPTHPFYKFVEALYAAGITAGCGNGNFCPDANVTRGQMAVFLSAALGLHFAP